MSQRIINFQLTPYGDNIVSSIENPYDFSEDNIPEILTANLSIISKQSDDIYSVDSGLFLHNAADLEIYPTVFVVTVDNIYSSHVYVWEMNNVVNMSGLNSIYEEYIFDILQAIEDWIIVLNNNPNLVKIKYVRVLQPNTIVADYIAEKDFRLAKTIPKLNNETLHATGNTPLVNNLLFREYDYLQLYTRQ